METKKLIKIVDDIKKVWNYDHPQTAISKLKKACDLFIKDKDYKGLLVFFKNCVSMSWMLEDVIVDVIDHEDQAISECGGESLRALFQIIKGKMVNGYYQQKDAYKQAMSHPEELEIPLNEFEWFTGADVCRIVYDNNGHPVFGHDLLSYIAQETKQYDILKKYHLQANNKDAAFYAQCMYTIQYERERKLSDLIENNDDTPLILFALEYLIEKLIIIKNHYKPIEDRNLSVSKVIKLLNGIMEQFPNWPNIGLAAELLEQLSDPEVNVRLDKETILPNKPYTFSLERKNVSHIKLSIYRSMVENRNSQHELNSEYIEKSFEENPVYQKEYLYENSNTYLWISSVMEIEPLQPGLYKVVLRADGRICYAEKIRVSQLCLLGEQLPQNRQRIVVLDAETGLPVPQAQIRHNKKKEIFDTKSLILDILSETVCDTTKRNNCFYPYKQDDQWAETVHIWGSYKYDKMKSRCTGDILTDRSIYRPGQTAHVTIVCYNINVNNQVRTLQRDNIKITIKESGYGKHIWLQKVKTDEYGIGYMNYHIPNDLAPGRYDICWGDNCSTSIQIEEYKRPTFEVKMEPYTKPYKMGDTITVRGKATSFDGVPITNAKVNYIINSEESSWFFRLSYFWNYGINVYRFVSNYQTKGESFTDHEGNFQIEVPLLVDDGIEIPLVDIPLFLDIVAYADVVDMTGETQCGIISLPVSNREYILYAEVEYKMEKSEGFVFTPIVRNSAGEIHKCEINYRVDDEDWHTAASGKKVQLWYLEVGKHILQLEYDGEHAQRKFILFDKDSLSAPCETDCWEYQSSDVFPEDGSPVVIQVGNNTPGTYILYDIFSGESHVDSGAVKTETGMIRWELPYDPKFGNGILINFAWVRNQKVQHCSMAIKKPLPDMKLNLNWLSRKGDYTPKGHVKWIAKVDNPKGQIVPSNMIAVVYDKALDQLRPHSWMEFGPDLDWIIPETEWHYNRFYAFNRHWRASESPYDDNSYDCDCIRREQSRGGHKGGLDGGFYGSSGYCLSEMIKIRSNFTETAYFASNLRSKENGEIEVEFDLPDTLTTWKLMIVTFTKDMHWCSLEEEFISRKDMMVTANMPRFMRVGDKAVISAKVTNQSGQKMKAIASMELLDTKSRVILFSDSRPMDIGTGFTMPLSFHFVPDGEVDQYICRVFVQCDTCSDGEERIIPVLADKTMVTTTYVLDQDGPGIYQVHPSQLFPVGTKHRQLSLEYTNNALWQAVKAMGGLVEYDKKNAISLTAALYSALLTKYLTVQALGGAIDDKSDEKTDFLMGLFKKFQCSDGGFCWYKGMASSEYITTEVLMHLSRLSAIIDLPQKIKDMMEDAFGFVDKEMHKKVKKLREDEQNGFSVRMPSFTMFQHLYNYAISGRKITRRNREDFDYLVNLMLRDIHRQTIYEKAMSAIILEHAGNIEQAKEYVESLCQYSELDGNRGRSFNTSRASYSWYSYKIPTHVAAMEAIHRICPDRRQEIVEMQKWLLNEKRTQTWETPIDSVNAIHALLFGNIDTLHEKITTAISVDGRMLECETEGKEGHLKAELDPRAQLISFDKKSKGISWGAVYAKFLQPLSEVSASVSGMTIKREIIAPKAGLHVGDRIIVRLTYTCDRNYDMVEVVDSKAACMEPVKQLSWSDSFKHVASYDTKTVISYYGLAEGTYSMETEFWLDRPGAYEIGLATIQCAYAPEFRATCPSQRLVVLP